MAEKNVQYSVSPSGEKIPLPQKEEYAKELARLEKLTGRARGEGKEIVVVMGVGFVGAVMAAIVADTVDKKGQARQVRHRVPTAQPAQLLEDPDAQSGASRRSRPKIPRWTRLSPAASSKRRP